MGVEGAKPLALLSWLSLKMTVLDVAASLSGRRWVWRRGEDRIGFAIAERLGLSEMLGRLMVARGIGLDDAAHFLDPTLRVLLPDPLVLTDMAAAADRLAFAVRRGETVAVFGDYDVDGACSGALMAGLLRELGCSVISYVPDRLSEGYGPSARALLTLAERGARLVVCVDCGTAAGDALAVLAGRADVVVLDHHKADHVPVGIVATVNPNRLDDRSGLGSLCAAAVAFMTAIALVRVLRKDGFFDRRPEPDLMGLLDLVALATVCDVMPLRGLNRALVAQGLKVMARRARPGIAALLEVAGVKDIPTAFSCGFGLGPRINAAGRISECDMGLRLLLARDPSEAREIALLLDEVNRQRQHVESSMLESALADGAAQAARGLPVLFVHGAAWHPGVVGIVAGRIKERQNRPACVGGLVNGVIKGSGRSVPGLDLGAAVIAALQSGILLTGGGHAMAAGFSLAAERAEDFHAFLAERLADACDLPSAADLPVEAMLTVPGATMDLARELSRLAPFGSGNEEPTFVLPRTRVLRADRIGKEGGTIRAFIEGEGGGARLKTMIFRAGDGALAAAFAQPSTRLHLAGHLRAEHWNGSETVSFVVTDAAVA